MFKPVQWDDDKCSFQDVAIWKLFFFNLTLSVWLRGFSHTWSVTVRSPRHHLSRCSLMSQVHCSQNSAVSCFKPLSVTRCRNVICIWKQLVTLICAASLGLVEVPPYGVIMNASSHCYEKMPDGVGKWDEAIALKENYAHHVEDASHHQFTHTWTLHLEHK